MENSAFYQFLLDAYTRMYESMADDASIYVFHADTEGLNFRRAFADAGFYLSGCCIWKKQSLVLGRSPYQWMHEPCLFGWKKSGKHQWCWSQARLAIFRPVELTNFRTYKNSQCTFSFRFTYYLMVIIHQLLLLQFHICFHDSCFL